MRSLRSTTALSAASRFPGSIGHIQLSNLLSVPNLTNENTEGIIRATDMFPS